MERLLRAVDHPVIRAFSSIIRRAVADNVSSRGILRTIRATGGGIRDSIGFRAIADIRERVRLERNLRFLNLDQRPNPLRIPESLTPLRRNFSFVVGIGPVTINGRNTFRHFVTVTSDVLLTRREIEDAALSFEGDNYVDDPFEGLSAQLQGGRKTPGGITL